MHLGKYATLLFRHLSRWVHHSETITFVTGANAPFYNSMKDNLLASIRRFEPDAEIVVWNLGLTDAQMNELQFIANEWGGVKIESFPFERLPEHYALENQNYAFKSYCVFETLRNCQTEYLLWLDAGCGLAAPLWAERNLMHRYGFYSPYSATTIEQLTHPSVMEAYLDSRMHMGNRQMLAAGMIGVRTDSEKGVAVVVQWHHECRLLELLAPKGSDKSNHRQDQSVLSWAYYSRNQQVPLLARRWINVKFHLHKGGK